MSTVAAEEMRVGLCDATGLSDEVLRFGAQLGIRSVRTSGWRVRSGENRWEYEELRAFAERVESYGLRLEAIENVPYEFYDKVLLGLPGRDEQMENYRATIRNMGRAGIPILGYHFMPNSVWSTSREPIGRGGATVRVFDMAAVTATPASAQREFSTIKTPVMDAIFAHAGEHPVSAEQMWENYAYFLQAALPVAEEAGVRLALHPDDPPVESLGGVARIFKSPDDFKRGHEMANGSTAWSLDLCLGCCSEMAGGAANVREMIEFFGPKGCIAYVHFRDVQGSVPRFAECFIGEGNYNAAQTMRLLKTSGFTGFVLDDHVPRMVGDEGWNFRGRAHAIGYMQGLLDSIEAQ